MITCKTCQKDFRKGDRHLECPKCRISKRSAKARECLVCEKLFTGKLNYCNSCKFKKWVKPEKNCKTCSTLHTRPGRHCAKCHRQFYKTSYKAHDSRHAGRRKKLLDQRNMKWADNSKIKQLYVECPEGFQVDHIIPLKNKNVSGLHVEFNLQYLTKKDNNMKRNKFDSTYDNSSWKGGR